MLTRTRNHRLITWSLLCAMIWLAAACAAPATPAPAAAPAQPAPTTALAASAVPAATAAPVATVAPAPATSAPAATAVPAATTEPAATATPSPAAETPQAAAALTPAAKQELIVGTSSDQWVVESNRQRLGMYPLNGSICETLVRMSADFQVVPALATKWEYRGDNTYRFYLRPGVKFHDGTPLNAAAVKYSLDRTVKTKIDYGNLTEDSTTIVDDLTVDVKPAQPNLRLLQQLVHPGYGIVALNSDPMTRPVCTGPFKFVEYVKEDHFTVERNDAYWGTKAKLDKITFRFIPDADTRLMALQAGDVDFITDVSRGQVPGIKGLAGIRLVAAPPGSVYVLFMTSHGEAPYTRLADPIIRKAVALALDRQTFVAKILEGLGTVVNTVNPPAILGANASLITGVAYDPKEAARILDEAGWKLGADKVRAKDGQRLALSMVAQPGRVDATVAQFVQAQLAEVGIEVKIEQTDTAAYATRQDVGQYDLDIEAPSQNDANPAFLLLNRWYSKASMKSAARMAVSAEFDTLLEGARAASDPAEVQKKAAEAMHLLVDQEVVAVPLAGISRIYAMSDKVQGFEPHPATTHQWWDAVWMAQ